MDLAQRANATSERREFASELRVVDKSDGLTFDGVASVVDTPYSVRDAFGEFTETIVKGAFAKTLKESDDVRLLVNHDGLPLARTKSKTLTLRADPHLRSMARLDGDNPRVAEIRSAMNRGDLDQMSIGFRVTRQEWNEDYTERHIRELQLFDVSVVTFPASPTTSASLRSIDDVVRFAETHDLTADELRRGIAVMQQRLAELDDDADADAEARAIAAAIAESARRARLVA